MGEGDTAERHGPAGPATGPERRLGRWHGRRLRLGREGERTFESGAGGQPCSSVSPAQRDDGDRRGKTEKEEERTEDRQGQGFRADAVDGRHGDGHQGQLPGQADRRADEGVQSCGRCRDHTEGCRGLLKRSGGRRLVTVYLDGRQHLQTCVKALVQAGRGLLLRGGHASGTNEHPGQRSADKGEGPDGQKGELRVQVGHGRQDAVTPDATAGRWTRPLSAAIRIRAVSWVIRAVRSPTPCARTSGSGRRSTCRMTCLRTFFTSFPLARPATGRRRPGIRRRPASQRSTRRQGQPPACHGRARSGPH